ncbi:FAD-dependent oxidoreductase [Natranaeroarchaeum sulfidigenes]|uniref:Protoporphyrinogen oxidase n=1 Tax=Natranaeroarchaeum sulfidigenes TaxID=2784880 RepID=A0A897MUF1_9EURY|nr:FAD-dependent oxidoreductase [Natranaeroarchaeum sulfidigenes]QSG04134.1 Protoporphyrinogen oxidase [Natranaeroarchaeum sulfidigenes]
MIGVIGGGIAGLTAAHELLSRDHEVRVFESGARVGSEFAPVHPASDAVLPRHPPRISPTGAASRALARALDVELDGRAARTGYYLDGVVHPIDRRHELLAFPPLSLRDTSYFRSLVDDGGVPPFTVPDHTLDEPESLADVTARSFVTEHATESLYEQAIEPLLYAHFGDEPDRISASWLINRVTRHRADSTEIVEPRSLVDALAGSIGRDRLHTDCRVTAVGTRRGAVDHLVTIEDGARHEYNVDAVIFDTPPRRLVRLTGGDWAGQTSGTTTVCFGLDEPLLSIDRVTVVDETPVGRLVALPGPTEGVEQALYAIVADESAKREPESQVRHGIESLFPAFDPSTIQWSAVHTETIPVPNVGYSDHIIPYDGPALSGGFYAGAASRERYANRSLDAAVRTAKGVGEAVAEHIG